MKLQNEVGTTASLAKAGKLFLLMAMAFCLTILWSCEKDDDNDDESDEEVQRIVFNGNEIGNGNQEFEIFGTHTLKKGTYVLKGWVYITDGAQLTIEPGTVIKGDIATQAALIAERGGKLIARGTASEPIVFTSNQPAGSRKPGDWGGIILCGKAVNNKTKMTIEGGPRSEHGGNDNTDNSGILSYVRIEFAGYPFDTDAEINGLTLGSVGSGTQIDHVQVSYCNDDSFEWFGGSVNAKYLIAYKGWDDDFDTDNGYCGKLQFLLAVRDSRLADNSASNGFESDNESNGTAMAPVTSPVFSNVTMVGPMALDAAFSNTTDYINGGAYNPMNGSKLGQFQSSVQIRRSSRLSCYNSVFTGYPVGIMIENDKGSATQSAALEGLLAIKNVYVGQNSILGSDKNKSFKDAYSANSSDLDESKESFSASFFKTEGFGNRWNLSASELALDLEGNFGPAAGSALVGKSNLFADSVLQNSFFDKVDYIGAFKSNSSADNWTAGWACFDPQNEQY